MSRGRKDGDGGGNKQTRLSKTIKALRKGELFIIWGIHKEDINMLIVA